MVGGTAGEGLLRTLAERVSSVEGQTSQEQESKEWSQAAEVHVGVHGEKVSHVHLNHLHAVDFIKTESYCPANQWWFCVLTSSCFSHLLFTLHHSALSAQPPSECREKWLLLTRWVASFSSSSCSSYSSSIPTFTQGSRSSKPDPGLSCPLSRYHPSLSPQKQQLSPSPSGWQNSILLIPLKRIREPLGVPGAFSIRLH